MAQPRDFGFGSEEQMLRDSARKFLKDTMPVDKLRTLVAGDHEEAYEAAVQPLAFDEAHWQRAVALGWTAIAVPEDAGGAEMKWIALAALVEEIGQAALPCPLGVTLAATAVLRSSEGAGARQALEQIAGGASATLANLGSDGSWDAQSADIDALASDGAITLNGKAHFVQDARKADLFVVAAREGSGVSLFAVAKGTPGLSIDPDRIADLTRDQAVLAFEDVSIADSCRIGAAGSAGQALKKAEPVVLTLAAADMIGAAEWQLQTTAEYARVRKQFDHEIGFFQAVKHPIVNMMIDLDRARSLVYAAACALDAAPEEAPRLAHMAQAAASDTAAFCASRSVQLHGGIGFTWECDVHIWFKRQKHSQLLHGDGAWHRAKLAELY